MEYIPENKQNYRLNFEQEIRTLIISLFKTAGH